MQGYLAGNPVTDDRFDTAGKIQFFHGMGMLSDELYEVIHHLTKVLTVVAVEITVVVQY